MQRRAAGAAAADPAADPAGTASREDADGCAAATRPQSGSRGYELGINRDFKVRAEPSAHQHIGRDGVVEAWRSQDMPCKVGCSLTTMTEQEVRSRAFRDFDNLVSYAWDRPSRRVMMTLVECLMSQDFRTDQRDGYAEGTHHASRPRVGV
jgi:hypothetical protein